MRNWIGILVLLVLCAGWQGWLVAQVATSLRAPEFPFGAALAEIYQRDFARSRNMPVAFQHSSGMIFRLIPPGTFRMGSPENEAGHKADELVHSVTLTQPFYVAKHEVTVEQFRRFVSATNYVTDVEKNGGGHAHDALAVWEHRPGTTWKKPGFAGPFAHRDDHPVVHVSITDAREFCRWLNTSANKADGIPFALEFDLPTEAQWEWSCRAGSGERFWWGAEEDTTGKVANVGDRTLMQVHPQWPRTIMPMDDGFAFVAPVGRFRANPFGLHDMLGNVWEFCSTRHGAYPKDAVTDPGDLGTKESFDVRGGGWSNMAADCRCATRNADPPHFGHSNLGFRVAIKIPTPSP